MSESGHFFSCRYGHAPCNCINKMRSMKARGLPLHPEEEQVLASECIGCHEIKAIEMHQEHYAYSHRKEDQHEAVLCIDYILMDHVRFICAVCGYKFLTKNHTLGDCKHG